QPRVEGRKEKCGSAKRLPRIERERPGAEGVGHCGAAEPADLLRVFPREFSTFDKDNQAVQAGVPADMPLRTLTGRHDPAGEADKRSAREVARHRISCQG